MSPLRVHVDELAAHLCRHLSHGTPELEPFENSHGLLESEGTGFQAALSSIYRLSFPPNSGEHVMKIDQPIETIDQLCTAIAMTARAIAGDLGEEAIEVAIGFVVSRLPSALMFVPHPTPDRFQPYLLSACTTRRFLALEASTSEVEFTAATAALEAHERQFGTSPYFFVPSTLHQAKVLGQRPGDDADQNRFLERRLSIVRRLAEDFQRDGQTRRSDMEFDQTVALSNADFDRRHNALSAVQHGVLAALKSAGLPADARPTFITPTGPPPLMAGWEDISIVIVNGPEPGSFTIKIMPYNLRSPEGLRRQKAAVIETVFGTSGLNLGRP